MPTYVYRCPICKAEKEVTHPIKQVDDPSDVLQLETSCNPVDCKYVKDAPDRITPGMRWERVPQLVAFDSFSTMSKEDKMSKLAKRSSDHNKKQGADEELRERTKSAINNFKG